MIQVLLGLLCIAAGILLIYLIGKLVMIKEKNCYFYDYVWVGAIICFVIASFVLFSYIVGDWAIKLFSK